MDVLNALRSEENDEVLEQFESGLRLLKRVLTLYTEQELALSFNAGALGGIRCFMFVQEDEFEEIREFSADMDREYGLHLSYLKCPMHVGLRGFVDAHGIKAVMLGTRRGDPSASGQGHFSPTTEEWPPVMRINPILDWSYQTVWGFLRRARVPYCKLYDVGYTSIGSVTTTRPNSALRKKDGTYAPAFLLSDSRLERVGRKNSRSAAGDDPAGWTRRAALLIIGDELLSGKVEDVNVAILCRELRVLGWIVHKVVFVGDDVDAISEEVHALSVTHDIVLTAGGLGPTVDDVTMQGVANAMQTTLSRHPYLVQLMKDFFKEDITEAHMKMTEVPQDEVEFVDTLDRNGKPTAFPLVQCRNVYMLPGVPEYLVAQWKTLKKKLTAEQSLPPFYNIVLRLKLTNETEIAPALVTLSEEMGPEIQIGSYPVKEQRDGANVLVCIESKVPTDVQMASDTLFSMLSPGAVLSRIEQMKKMTTSRNSQKSMKKSPLTD